MAKFNYFALGISAVFVVMTGFSINRATDYIASTLTADGVVVAIPVGPHHPRVTFTDSGGNVINFNANGDITQNVGDHVQVRYRQENPARSARLDTFGSLWGTTLFLLAMALGFAIAGFRNLTSRGWGPKT